MKLIYRIDLIKIKFKVKWFVFKYFYSKTKFDINFNIIFLTQCKITFLSLLVKLRFGYKINLESKLPNIENFHKIKFTTK